MDSYNVSFVSKDCVTTSAWLRPHCPEAVGPGGLKRACCTSPVFSPKNDIYTHWRWQVNLTPEIEYDTSTQPHHQALNTPPRLLMEKQSARCFTCASIVHPRSALTFAL